jgi:hypothetical protein
MQTVVGKPVATSKASPQKVIYDVDKHDQSLFSKTLSFVEPPRGSPSIPTTVEEQSTQKAQQIHPASSAKSLTSPKAGILPTPKTIKHNAPQKKKASNMLLHSDDQGPPSWADLSLGTFATLLK